jgi:hypothetical protein
MEREEHHEWRLQLDSCANDGVLLAADSQETIPGYIKGDTGKIRTTFLRIAMCFPLSARGLLITSKLQKVRLSTESAN